MKNIVKFLKLLKTDRHTFLTYISTLISIYLVIDRLVELLFLCFTGISLSYWGPIKYTLALACPVFAFCFSFSSKFIKSSQTKLSFFYVYCIALYIIALSMFVQFGNKLFWLIVFSAPNYVEILTEFPDLLQRAFSALALYLPLVTFYPLFRWLFMKLNDTKDIRDSIMDYGGIDLSDKSEGWGPYTCEIKLCKDKDTGKTIKTPEVRRFESTFICGVSGSRKNYNDV